jgi:hypothetical protein
MTTHGSSSSTTAASRASVKFIPPKRTFTVLLVQTPSACAGNAVQGALVGVDRNKAPASDAATREVLSKKHWTWSTWVRNSKEHLETKVSWLLSTRTFGGSSADDRHPHQLRDTQDVQPQSEDVGVRWLAMPLRQGLKLIAAGIESWYNMSTRCSPVELRA